MKWNQSLTNLRDVLSGLYPTIQDSRRVVEEAGLNPMMIAFETKAVNNWFHILKEALNHNKIQAIVAVAFREYPENAWLTLAMKGDLFAVKGPDINTDITWKGSGVGGQLEKIIGVQNTILPISFLALGLLKSRSVGRIVCANGSIGTGFLLTNNYLITNHHVLPNQETAQEAVVQFNYQKTIEGLDEPVDIFKFVPQEGFATSPMEENDWTAVCVAGEATQKWGGLELTKVTPAVHDYVNIIQHPGGGYKQIALYHNLLAYVDNTRLQYYTDTMPGSSGSPVFDSQWLIVGLHHSGGWLREGGTEKLYFRNEGVHINAVIDGLVEKGIISEM